MSQWSRLAALLAVLLVQVPAARASPAACNLLTSGSCMWAQTPATCAAQCTAPAFVATCDGQCTDSASVACTGSCNTSCQSTCVANPGTFDCATDCASNCQTSCSTVCNGESAGCADDCMSDCTNRCGIQCAAVPPNADCNALCQGDCNASCQTQANIDCQVNCMSTVAAGECSADCATSQGAVFCGNPPQYVDLSTAATDCVTYLESEGIAPDAGPVAVVKKHQGCGSAPGGEGLGGALEAAGLLLGFGLLVARRRRA